MDTPPSDGPEPQSRRSAESAPGDHARSRFASLHDSLSRWYPALWVGAGLFLVLAFAWVRWQIGGDRTTQVATDGFVAAGAILAASGLTLCGWGSKHQSRGWKALAVGAWFEVAGELTWFSYTVFAGANPYPGPADVFYLLGYPFLAAGFLLLASNPDQPRQMIRLGLDGLVVGTALLSLVWHFVLEPILAISTLDSLATWVSIVYPIADILLAAVAFVIAMNMRGARRFPLLLVAGGVLCWAFGDTAFAYLEVTTGYTYDELSLSWLVGDLAIALGAIHPSAAAPPRATDRRQYEFHELISPYVPFGIAMLLMGYQGILGVVDAYDFAFAGIVILALLARQSYVLADATRLSRELETSEQVLDRRNQELLLINRIVRHDIRNDMAVAHGWAGELADHVDEDGEPMLDRILATTQHTIDLTETLREFVAALEPGEYVPLEAIPLREYFEETLQSRRETYPEAEFSAGDIPDVDVRANPLLATVFRNLLNNAVQHTDTDHPQIDVDVTETDGTVQVRIADNGPGIPDERKERIFHRDEKGLESAGGGIGLYLVDTLVDHYRGDVWVEDNEPRGSVFVVELRKARR